MALDYITRGDTLQNSVPKIWQAEGKRGQAIPKSRETSDGGEYRHELDKPEWQERLKKLMQWRKQARVYQADNRMEMAVDEDFYDAIQYEPEDLKILMDRHQPPLVYNVIKNTINWVLGTERKSKIDFRVNPRTHRDYEGAQSKTKLIKYYQDVSRAEFMRSEAFAECVKAGLGWLEIGTRFNGDEPIFIRTERWRNMWFDHLSLEPDGSDMRYVFREKWVDLDIVQAMFPERKDDLKVLAEAVNSLYPYRPDDIVITDNASEFDLESDLDSLYGGPFDGMRERVKVVEFWYRLPANVEILKMRDPDTPYGALDGAIFRPDQPDHQYLKRGGYFSTFEAYVLTVRMAIWAGATYLQDILSPYNHNRIPFVPLWCYRMKRNNLPYGVIRDLRDPQRDLNARRTRSLFLLSAHQVIAEKGVVDDPQKFQDELNRPDGYAEINEGKSGLIKEVEHKAEVQIHVQLGQDDERFIQNISGISPPSLGEEPQRELSGKAMKHLEVQGLTTSGVVFDNYWFSNQLAGEILLSLIEQFCDQQKEYLITGKRRPEDEFITVNERTEDGQIKNAITREKARFIIGKQDYRETMRIAMMETLGKILDGLAKGMPQVALGLLDLVVDMMDDLPNKHELVSRIRKFNKQHAPEDEMTPEEKEQFKQAEQVEQQNQQLMEAMQQALAKAEVAIKQAEAQSEMSTALKNHVEAQMQKLEGFLKALEVASQLSMTPGLAKAADTLIAESQAAPGRGGNGRQLTPR